MGGGECLCGAQVVLKQEPVWGDYLAAHETEIRSMQLEGRAPSPLEVPSPCLLLLGCPEVCDIAHWHDALVPLPSGVR